MKTIFSNPLGLLPGSSTLSWLPYFVFSFHFTFHLISLFSHFTRFHSLLLSLFYLYFPIQFIFKVKSIKPWWGNNFFPREFVINRIAISFISSTFRSFDYSLSICHSCIRKIAKWFHFLLPFSLLGFHFGFPYYKDFHLDLSIGFLHGFDFNCLKGL